MKFVGFRAEIRGGLSISLMMKFVAFGMRFRGLCSPCVFGLRIVCLASTATATATVQARRPGWN